MKTIQTLPLVYSGKVEKEPNTRQMRMIVAAFVYGNERGREMRSRLTPGDFGAFLKNIPEPSAFELYTEEYIKTVIEPNNLPAKVREYRESAKRLEAILYGKRYEYWTQIQYLQEEAAKTFPSEHKKK